MERTLKLGRIDIDAGSGDRPEPENADVLTLELNPVVDGSSAGGRLSSGCDDDLVVLVEDGDGARRVGNVDREVSKRTTPDGDWVQLGRAGQLGELRQELVSRCKPAILG